VSRFRAAELVGVDDGATVRVPAIELPQAFTVASRGPYEAAVAWRTVAAPDGGAWMVHQRETKAELVSSIPEYYGHGAVESGLTFVSSAGVGRTFTIAGATLPVDVAVSRTGTLAVVFAGDNEVMVIDPARIAPTEQRLQTRSYLPGVRQIGAAVAVSLRRPVAAAWMADTLLVQYLDPPAIAAYGNNVRSGETFLELGEPAARDAGHEIFHTPTSQRIACASCHPEGMDDGHTWVLGDVGRRRTQPLGGGILDTAPYHWAGDLIDVRAFTDSIYVDRMGGVRLEDHEVEALGQWLHTIPDLPAGAARDNEAVARGREIFAGEAGCASCHSGARGTDGRNHDVGTGGSFQTPALVGIAQRTPLFHDGCARTLEERFDRCHTDGHGHIADLDDRERADLIAYLASR
jgi:mono/diheme cytochrome c family protein